MIRLSYQVMSSNPDTTWGFVHAGVTSEHSVINYKKFRTVEINASLDGISLTYDLENPFQQNSVEFLDIRNKCKHLNIF